MEKCEDCGDVFKKTRPWKYEPDVKLCENCYEQRLMEEQKDE